MQSGITTQDQKKCLTTQTVAVDRTERSQYQIQLNLFSSVLVIRPVGELAEDLVYKKNTVYLEKTKNSLNYNILTKKTKG